MKVELLSGTHKPFATVAMIWEASRTKEPITTVRTNAEDRNLFFKLMDEGIPVMDMVELIFLLEGIPISLREQMVRHRLGGKFGGQIGMDIIPDLMDSAWWMQSMRILDMREFAEKSEEYFIPETIRNNKQAFREYEHCMTLIQRAYNQLTGIGIPKEDARQVIPLGATHRLVWKLSLTAVKHICSKRSCWIAQLGMWSEIIAGMVSELAKIDRRFHNIVSPPCIKQGEFGDCQFCVHNEKRVRGVEGEEMPPCPLYLHQVQGSAGRDQHLRTPDMWQFVDTTEGKGWICREEKGRDLMTKMKAEYKKLWNRKTDTGEQL